MFIRFNGNKQHSETLRMILAEFNKIFICAILLLRRKWQPTPVFLPGESHGQRSLAGHGPWGRRDSDTTEVTWLSTQSRNWFLRTLSESVWSNSLMVQFNRGYNSRVKWSESRSVMSDSLWPHGLYSPWNSPGQNTGVGSLFLLQRIFPTQGSNLGLPHCRRILHWLSHKGSPTKARPLSKTKITFPFHFIASSNNTSILTLSLVPPTYPRWVRE